VVTDGRTNQPIPGVTIKVSNKVIETSSTASGSYELRASLPSGKYELTFNFLGYTN
jgi:hypothetical protein